MLGLTLRNEFMTTQMRGTQIDLDEFAHKRPTADILAITYPTADIRSALRAIADPAGRPVVLIGERGLGKSHILSLLHHAFKSPSEVEHWAASWVAEIADPHFSGLALHRGLEPISAQMGDQEF